MKVHLTSCRRFAPLIHLVLAAICLACVPMVFAQTDGPSQPSSSDQARGAKQGQPGDTDKSEQRSSESAAAKLRVIVTTPERKPVNNASAHIRFNTSGGCRRPSRAVEM